MQFRCNNKFILFQHDSAIIFKQTTALNEQRINIYRILLFDCFHSDLFYSADFRIFPLPENNRIDNNDKRKVTNKCNSFA